MARPREFDEGEALDRVMWVFWRQGFSGTSIANLVEVTGLQRQSLYNAFGDKQGLFNAALARYRERGSDLSAVLLSPSAGLTELRQFILATLHMQRELDCGTCMLIKTAFDPGMEDPNARAMVQQSADQWRERFARVLAQARQRGELPPKGDDAMLANYLFSVHNGLSALSRTGASEDAIERALDHAFASLQLAS